MDGATIAAALTESQFPHRITYDPYLRFPGGQEVDVAPLFDLLIGITVIVIGAGAPSAQVIDTTDRWDEAADPQADVVALRCHSSSTR